MCIIAAKPIGIKMPEDKIIQNMWNNNDDGAGFMWAEDGFVHIRKGFMTYEDFKQALDEFCKNHDTTKTPLVMHFRITTHGGTKPENCHPFPISDSVGMLSKPGVKCKVGVAHNGVIPITPRKGISDTMEYIASQLAPLSRAVPNFYKNKDLCEMILNATGSRLAFLNDKGEIFTIGDFVEDKGIKYSNSTFKYSGLRDFGWGHSYGWDDYSGMGTTGWSGTDDFYTDADGYYLMRSVMWLDSDFGYLTGVDDWEVYEDFAVDRDGCVYGYDYNKDAFIKIDGATAYSNTGTCIRFDPKSPRTTQELTYNKFKYQGGYNLASRDSKGCLPAPKSEKSKKYGKKK